MVHPHAGLESINGLDALPRSTIAMRWPVAVCVCLCPSVTRNYRATPLPPRTVREPRLKGLHCAYRSTDPTRTTCAQTILSGNVRVRAVCTCTGKVNKLWPRHCALSMLATRASVRAAAAAPCYAASSHSRCALRVSA